MKTFKTILNRKGLFVLFSLILFFYSVIGYRLFFKFNGFSLQVIQEFLFESLGITAILYGVYGMFTKEYLKTIKLIPIVYIYSMIIIGVIFFYIKYRLFAGITFSVFLALIVAHLATYNFDFLKNWIARLKLNR